MGESWASCTVPSKFESWPVYTVNCTAVTVIRTVRSPTSRGLSLSQAQLGLAWAQSSGLRFIKPELLKLIWVGYGSSFYTYVPL